MLCPQVAIKTQCADINSLVDKLVGDFQQEDKDSRMAKDLYEADIAAEKTRAEEKHRLELKDEQAAKDMYVNDQQQQKQVYYTV